MNPDTTMFYPLTALGEILSAKPAQLDLLYEQRFYVTSFVKIYLLLVK